MSHASHLARGREGGCQSLQPFELFLCLTLFFVEVPDAKHHQKIQRTSSFLEKKVCNNLLLQPIVNVGNLRMGFVLSNVNVFAL